MNLLSKMSEFHEIARNKLGEAQKVMAPVPKPVFLKWGSLYISRTPKLQGQEKSYAPLGMAPGSSPK
jgi:hypothetical protein